MPQTAPHLMRRIFFCGAADDLTFTVDPMPMGVQHGIYYKTRLPQGIIIRLQQPHFFFYYSIV
jgi:hypothetical protein